MNKEKDFYLLNGGRGQNRTGMRLPSAVFETAASTVSATRPESSQYLTYLPLIIKKIEFPAGHDTAGLFLPYIPSTALRHFQSMLG